MSNSVTIKASNSKYSRILIGCTLFMVAGFYFLTNDNAIQFTTFGIPVNNILLGSVLLLFFGTCALLIIRQMRSGNAGLTIGVNGIDDRSSYTAVGFIPWSDVSEMNVMQISGQDIIMIHVHNPDEYINRATGIKRTILRTNLKGNGTPVALSASGLDITHHELWELLSSGLNNYVVSFSK